MDQRLSKSLQLSISWAESSSPSCIRMQIDGTIWFKAKQKDALLQQIRLAGLFIEDKSAPFGRNSLGTQKMVAWVAKVQQQHPPKTENPSIKYSGVPRALDKKHILDANIVVYAGTAFLLGILQTRLHQGSTGSHQHGCSQCPLPACPCQLSVSKPLFSHHETYTILRKLEVTVRQCGTHQEVPPDLYVFFEAL
jgi:hypothetical protein